MLIRSSTAALDLTTGSCHITSQNHGYAVDAKTLPSDWKEYFINLNDGSSEYAIQGSISSSYTNLDEGIRHTSRPLFSVSLAIAHVTKLLLLISQSDSIPSRGKGRPPRLYILVRNLLGECAAIQERSDCLGCDA